MAKRDFDFSAAQKRVIIAYFNHVCAACGADEALHADHWQSGKANDDGVCLCYVCNGTKSNIKVPETLRLIPREPLNIITHEEYKQQVAANREAFAKWVSKYRGTCQFKPIHFKAPF